MPFFSTIIPAFNRGSLIRATIESALAQRDDLQNDDPAGNHFQELLLVDDGSTDQTFAILQEYERSHPGVVRAFQQPNSGPGSARNYGIREAKGQYIAFLDSDDLWFPWTLNVYRKVIESHGHPSMLLATAMPFTDEASLQRVCDTAIQVDTYRDFYSAAAISLWHGCSALVVRADVLRQSSGFTAKNINAEDTDLWMQLGDSPGFVHLRKPVDRRISQRIR